MDGITVQTIEDPAGIESLKEEWSELLEASSSNSVFLTWEWLRTWWKHLPAGRALRVMTARDGRNLVALVPLASRPRRLTTWIPLECLEFLGTGTVGSDYLDVIIRRDGEREALEALAEYVGPKPLMLHLAQVRRDDNAVGSLAERLRNRGWHTSVAPTGICPYIPLAGHTWVSYLGSLGPEHRYNFRRRLRNLAGKGHLHFDCARTEDERRQALAHLFRLHDLRWQEQGGSDAFDAPELRGFHDEFTRLALQRGWLRLFVLSLDGRPLSALYGLSYGQVFYFYQSGFDPRYSKDSVGLITMGLAIKHACEQGVREYDLLHGEESYKFHWTRAVRELQRIELYPPLARGQVCRRLMGWDRAARKLARRIIPPPLARQIDLARRRGLGIRSHATPSC